MTTAIRTLGALVLLALSSVAPLAADTYEVDRTDDSTVGICNPSIPGDCALRGAIIKANNHAGTDTIRLAAATYTLTLGGGGEDYCQTGDLDVRDALVIQGKGPERTVIDAAGIERVLQVLAPGARLTVRGVTITGGVTSSGYRGAGVYLEDGLLSLEGCVVSGNESYIGGAVADDAANTTDWVYIVDTWITDNTASIGSSGLSSSSRLLLSGSTISGNFGIASSGGSVTIEGNGSILLTSTISGNVGPYQGGVYIGASGVTVSGCTIADNTGYEIGSSSSFSSNFIENTIVVGTCTAAGPATFGGNLESPGDTCSFGAVDLVNVPDPMLSPLEYFGGPAPVHRPLPGSPAVDQPVAVANCPCSDQRNLFRPRDGDGDGATVCDIGAVELAGPGEIFIETFHSGYATGWSSVTW